MNMVDFDLIVDFIKTILAVIIGAWIAYSTNLKIKLKESKRNVLDNVIDILIEVDSIKHKVYHGVDNSTERYSDKIYMGNKIALIKIKCSLYNLDNTAQSIESFEEKFIGDDKKGYQSIEKAMKKDVEQHKL